MARLSVTDGSGIEIGVPDRLSSDDLDAPEVMIVVCEAGQFIDGSSEELRFVPPPAPPVIERVEVAVADDMGTGLDESDGGEIVLSLAPGDAAAIERIERHLKGDADEAKLFMKQLRERGSHDW